VEVGDGYIAMTVDRTLCVYSCYVSPVLPPLEFGQFLANLKVNVVAYRDVGVDLIVAGDFNAWSAVWGDCLTGRRGRDLCALVDFWTSALSTEEGGGSPRSSDAGCGQ